MQEDKSENADYTINPILKDPEMQEYIPVGKNLLTPPFMYCICGTRFVGKSSVCLNMVLKKFPFYLGAFDRIILISPTLKHDSTSRELVKYISEENAFDYYDDSIISALIDHNKSLPKELREKILIIADDLPAMNVPMNSLLYTTIPCAGRHFGISAIFLTQIFRGNNVGLPPPTRNNIEGLLVFRNSNQKQLNNLFEELGHFGSVSNIEAMYNDIVAGKPYQFLYFDSRKLKVYKNFDEEIWSMYDDNGNFNTEYSKNKKKEEKISNNI